jgi:hypothetical protein
MTKRLLGVVISGALAHTAPAERESEDVLQPTFALFNYRHYHFPLSSHSVCLSVSLHMQINARFAARRALASAGENSSWLKTDSRAARWIRPRLNFILCLSLSLARAEMALHSSGAMESNSIGASGMLNFFAPNSQPLLKS